MLGQALSYHIRWRIKKRLWNMNIPNIFNTHDIFQYIVSFVFIIIEVYYGGMYFLLHIIGTNIAFFIGSAPDHDMYTTHLQIEKTVSETDWGELQVNHSANFLNNYPLFTKFFGGINYQIEHHLFPSLTNHRLEQISPIVKQCCKDFNIHYHVVNNPWTVWGEIIKTYESIHK
jgi:fatty acid desaturase